jgi:hypothetical protein
VPKELVESGEKEIKEMVLESKDCKLDENEVEELSKTWGAHGLFLMWWWCTVMSKANFSFFNRTRNLLLESFTLKPFRIKTPVVSHCDIHSGNLMKKDSDMILVDFEMVNTAPGFLDLGALLFVNFDLDTEHMSKEKREMLVRSYLGLYEETEESKIRKPSGRLCCGQNKVNCREESIEEMLYDLEIGYYFRYMFTFYCICFHGDDKDIMDSGLFDLLLDRAEAMVEAFKIAEKDPKKFQRVVDLGVNSASISLSHYFKGILLWFRLAKA